MIAKLLLLAKAAATSVVKESRFVKEFDISDWGSGTFSVFASEHGKGASPLVDVWRLNGTSYIKSEGYPSDGWLMTTDEIGNITLSGQAFAGKVIVL